MLKCFVSVKPHFTSVQVQLDFQFGVKLCSRYSGKCQEFSHGVNGVFGMSHLPGCDCHVTCLHKVFGYHGYFIFDSMLLFVFVQSRCCLAMA